MWCKGQFFLINRRLRKGKNQSVLLSEKKPLLHHRGKKVSIASEGRAGGGEFRRTTGRREDTCLAPNTWFFFSRKKKLRFVQEMGARGFSLCPINCEGKREGRLSNILKTQIKKKRKGTSFLTLGGGPHQERGLMRRCERP